MKFFRKKQESEPIKDVLRGPSDEKATPASPSEPPPMYLGTAPNKEEAQRRFMQRLYKLSEAHGAASVKSRSAESSSSEDTSNKVSLPFLKTSGTRDTSPDTSQESTPDSTPDASPIMSPASSPPRVKQSIAKIEQQQDPSRVLTPSLPSSPAQANAEPPSQRLQETNSTVGLEKVDSAWDLGINPGCMRAMIQQIAACADDFFGDKYATASSHRRAPHSRRSAVGDTANRGLPVVEIPSVITFGPSRGPFTDIADPPEETTSKRKYVFEDELDGIIGNYDGYNTPRGAYKISEREGSSVIDNVWVVSSFAGEKEDVCVEEVGAVSVTSSISTRNSCMI